MSIIQEMSWFNQQLPSPYGQPLPDMITWIW